MGQVRRRQLLIAAGALLVAPDALLAQQAQKLRRIGVLSLSVSTSEQAQWGKLMFNSWMRGAGYEDGRNLAVEWRYAEGDVNRLPALAEELVRLNVELIMASFNDAIGAAKRATRSIPIVMFNSLNPVEQGFVESLARPGGNITGTAWSAPEFSAVEAAGTLGMEARVFGAARPEEIPEALKRIAAFQPQALYVALDTVLMSGLRDIVAYALKRKLPAIANAPQFTDAGGFLYYGPDLTEIGERTLNYVARILAGAKPADLPVELPSKFELVVNLRTAKLIGHKVPQSILLRASRVIE